MHAESQPYTLNPKPDPKQDASFTLLRSIWLDFFQLREVETISSIGVEHALVFTATGDSVTGGSVMMRHYMVRLKRLTLTRSPTRMSATWQQPVSPAPHPHPQPQLHPQPYPRPRPLPQQVKLKKSAEASGPYVELSEIGPSLDLAVRRVHLTDAPRL